MPRILLATLRPPTRDESTPGYRERIPPPPDGLASLLGPVDESIVVEITPEEIRVLAHDVEGGADAAKNAAVRALEILQLATGWYVFGALEDGFAPTSECPACSIERFAWQRDEPCVACGEAMRDEPPPEAKKPETKETIAETLVDTLLANEWLELVTMSSRKALVRDVAEFLHRRHVAAPRARVQKAAPVDRMPGAPARAVPLSSLAPAARAAALADAAASTPAAVAARAARAALLATAPVGSPGFELLDHLTDLPYVAEVYADEDTLAALLRDSGG